jgi:hypothetical protein
MPLIGDMTFIKIIKVAPASEALISGFWREPGTALMGYPGRRGSGRRL